MAKKMAKKQEFKIKLIPEEEFCQDCKKSLKSENQDTIIDEKTGKRYAYCESCFKKRFLKQK